MQGPISTPFGDNATQQINTDLGLTKPKDVYQFQLGGDQGNSNAFNADKDSAQFQNNAYNARVAAAPGTDYSGGDRYVAQGLIARGGQNDALGMLRSQANGTGPSAATMQGQMGTNQGIASQIGAVAGVHPGSASAAQGIYGQGQGALTNNIAQANAAKSAEMAQGQNSMFGGYQQQRGQDLSAMGQQDARSQYLTNLQMQQQGLNQNGSLAWEGMNQGARGMQLSAAEQQAALNQAHWIQQMKLDENATQNQTKAAMGGVGMVASTAAQAAKGSGA